jgi:hypothetical protein
MPIGTKWGESPNDLQLLAGPSLHVRDSAHDNRCACVIYSLRSLPRFGARALPTLEVSAAVRLALSPRSRRTCSETGQA